MEGLLCKAIVEAGKAAGLEPGYYSVVFLACLHAQQVERICAGTD